MEPGISPLRLWLLRAMYVLIAVGLGLTVWPLILSPPATADQGSVIRALLGAIALMAALGVRYPLKMLPVLLFELLWKVLWIATAAIPVAAGNGLDAYASETLFACLVGVVLVPLVVPWGHVRRQYFTAAGDPWRRPRSAVQAGVERSEAVATPVQPGGSALSASGRPRSPAR
jgi:hypothetical protein